MKITIKLQNGQSVEKITDSSKVVIGRSPRCDFSIQDAALSRNHCLVECVNGEFFITDLGSSNGVYLQGERIEPNHRIQFFTYIHLALASLECQVQDIDEEEMHAYTKTLTASMLTNKPTLPKPVAPPPPVSNPDEEALIQDILETVKAKESETPSEPSAPRAEKKISKEVLSSPPSKKSSSTPKTSPPPKPPKSIHSPERNIKIIALVVLCVVLYFVYDSFLAEPPTLP